jgi:hypothetical protein
MATPDLSLEATVKLLENLPRTERARLLNQIQQEKLRKKTLGPQNDDELWAWVRDEIGIEIPRVAVCPCHQAPFDFFSDAYFNRSDALLAIGSRESGKSLLAAIVNYGKAKFVPGHEGLTMAAIEEQARRVYAHLQKFIRNTEEGGKQWKPEIRDSIRRETHFYNGSKFEIIPGSPAAANGPHPHTVHVDELDQMDPLAFDESRNMSSSGFGANGVEIPAQDIATSTRKSAFGPVQQLVDEVETAVDAGMKPPWKIFTWCVYENAQERPDCQKVSYTERAARLTELGRDPCELCDCVMPDTAVHLLGVAHAGYRRFYSGPVVDLFTAGGKKLTVTRNHPVLTTRGWIAAYLLQEGDHVISRTTGNSAVTSDLDQVQTAEDLYASLHMDSSQISPSLGSRPDSVSPTAVDFHGDGMFTQGEIELVTTELGLSHVRDAELVEQLGKDIFTIGMSTHDSHVAQSAPKSAVGYAHLSSKRSAIFPSDVARDDLVADDDLSSELVFSGTSQPAQAVHLALHSVPRNSDLSGKSSRTFSGDIAIEDFNRDLVDTRRSGRSEGDSGFDHSGLESLLGDPGLFNENGHLLPSDVALDEIVEIRNRDNWSGHVYNFSTSSGAYLANGIVTHNCDKVAKGELSPGRPRTLADVCQGKLFKSRGWMKPKDVERKFRQNGELVWKAQQECALPEPEGIYIKNWSRDRHTILNWEPRPEYGPIYQGVDWGGEVPFAVEWYQGPTNFDVNVTSRIGHNITIPAGAIVNFSEIYIADTSATKLADMVVRRERLWAARYNDWRVHARFADPAGRSDRNAWRDHDPPLRTHFYVDREFEPMVNTVVDLVDDGLFYVVEAECPAFCDEIEAWRKDKNGRQFDKYNHAISAWRYAMKNIEFLERKKGRRIGQAPGDARRSGVKRGPAVASSHGRQFNDQLWRQELGHPLQSVHETAPWDPNR